MCGIREKKPGSPLQAGTRGRAGLSTSERIAAPVLGTVSSRTEPCWKLLGCEMGAHVSPPCRVPGCEDAGSIYTNTCTQQRQDLVV